MTDTAECGCGALKVEVAGEPAAVVACHCVDCQRRTGSVLGVGAYFHADQVTIKGDSRAYTRMSDAGNPFTTHFCPTCGTSLYWIAGNKPDAVGVAVGGFADPKFPPPARSVFEHSMHDWMSVTVAEGHFPKGRS